MGIKLPVDSQDDKRKKVIAKKWFGSNFSSSPAKNFHFAPTEIVGEKFIPPYIKEGEESNSDIKISPPIVGENNVGGKINEEKNPWDTLRLARQFIATLPNENTFPFEGSVILVDKMTGVRCDQEVTFGGFYSAQDYPEKLRRIKHFDAEMKRYYAFVTNNFDLSAETIVGLYKQRWQVGLFFKWIKQHLNSRPMVTMAIIWCV